MSRKGRTLGALAAAALASLASLAALVAPAAAPAGAATAASSSSPIRAVGAESQYANVISQIGGRYVQVASILHNPNTDPHSFEASPRVAQEVGQAELVVQNGLGYDAFMNDIEGASANRARKVIVVQQLRHLPNNTPNPHLWYDPATMPKVATAIADDLATLAPQHAAAFRTNLRAFDASLKPLLAAIAAFKAAHPNTPVATTEPVADYLLSALGMHDLTPFVVQADIMNGVDPSPQGVTQEDHFFSSHLVKVFCYNQQVVDSLTASIRASAQSNHVPVVGVYETMPTGFTYQSWMLAEVRAISAAVTAHTSTQRL